MARARVIQKEADFLQALTLGRQFWYMDSGDDGEPLLVRGPVTLVEYRRRGEEWWVIIQEGLRRGGDKTAHCVTDFANPCRGVFLSARSALEYFGRQRRAYQKSPGRFRRELEMRWLTQGVSWNPESQKEEDPPEQPSP